MNSKKNLWLVLGVLALAVAGFIVMPLLIRKYSNKLYKASNKKEEIDFDNLGPEIVNKDDVRKEDYK